MQPVGPHALFKHAKKVVRVPPPKKYPSDGITLSIEVASCVQFAPADINSSKNGIK
jgi:hypothetical protein